MDFNTFAQNRKDCYTSENGFLMWRLTGGDSFVPCLFDGDGGNIVAHILMRKGELRLAYDESVYTLPANSFSTFLDHPKLQLLSASPDATAYITVSKESYDDALLKNNPPIPFSYVLKLRTNPVRMPDAEMLCRLRLRMEGIREACMDTDNIFRDKMIKCAIWMLLMDIADRHIRSGGREDPETESDRTMQLFVGFMRLLPTHAVTEHFTGFYADHLCVTPQYLNRIVKSLSGRTVSGWINFTLVGEITKQLENTKDTMQQIATNMGFPDQATLTKFYKRETGYSLTEYRKRILRGDC